MEEYYIRELLSAVHRRVLPEELGQTASVQRQEELMVCVLEGTVEYHFSQTSLILQPGDILFLPRDFYYRRRFCHADYLAIFVYFRFDEAPPVEYRLFRAAEEENDFMRLYKIWRAQGPAARSECLGLLYRIYARLLQREQGAHSPRRNDSFLKEAMQKIADGYTEPTLSVSGLADEAGMSEVHFRRCFKEQFQVTPGAYILNLRLTRARELLHYHDGPIEGIAAACGFADPSYFSRLFKKKTGYTPTEYRKQF